MELSEFELKQYEQALSPLIRYLSSRFDNLQRIAVCDGSDEILVICDSKIVISIDRVTFECKYCYEKIQNNSNEVCKIVNIFCKKLSCFQYKIRQVVAHSQTMCWNKGIIKGEIKVSVDKVGEKVVMLIYR